MEKLIFFNILFDKKYLHDKCLKVKLSSSYYFVNFNVCARRTYKR